MAKAVVEKLQCEYLKTHNTVKNLLEILENFSKWWNFPNIIGAIDGKDIVLQQPNNLGSHYRNCKGTDSIILMAVVGLKYQLLYADVALNERNSDGGACAQSAMKKALEKNTLNLPKLKPLFRDDTSYVCFGDDVFPLATYMMKAYPRRVSVVIREF